jgi:fatty-acyl-CoA synthase
MTGSWLTLPQALEHAAGTKGGLFFVHDDGSETFEPYSGVRARAMAIARALARHGIEPGQRVALLIPEAEGFVPALYGVSMVGAAAVPMAPPMGPDHIDGFLDTCRRMIRTAEVSAIVASPMLRPVLGTLQSASPSVRGVWSWTDLVREPGEYHSDVSPDAVALLQFTSGSTSHPKGVVLTHANLAANVSAITGPSGLDVKDGDVGVSWLPLFHDMGLIGVVMGVVGTGIPCVLMPPLLFVKRPVEWLRIMTRHRGTLSFGPNFAYELCARRAGDHLDGLDLSAWRVAGCGAEPIRRASLDVFAQAFAPVGFRATSFLPSYGLAEYTLAATFHHVGAPLRIDHVKAEMIREKGRAVICAATDPDAMELVGCGRAFPGHTVRIVGADDQTLPERQVGEVLLQGPSTMKGYYRDEVLTGQVLRGGWLRTGDLGYLADGDLFVCGRKKDMIIVHGRNYYPQDLEWAAGEVEGTHRGNVVAFGVSSTDGSEQVVIVAECLEPQEEGTLAARISRRIQETSGLTVNDVVIVPRGTLPKTSSGKVQRARVKSRYEAGRLLQPKAPHTALWKHLVASRWAYTTTALKRLADHVVPADEGDDRVGT